MLSIADIRQNETILSLVRAVTNQFLQSELSTPRPEFYQKLKLKDRDEIIRALVVHGFLQQPSNDLIPGLLGFEYSLDPKHKRQAKGCANMVLRTLAGLFEASGYRQRRFQFDEIFTQVKVTYKLAHPAEVRLGLLLIPTLGAFVSHSQWNSEHSSYESVEVTDAVVGGESIDTIWDLKLKEILKRDEEGQVLSRFHKSKQRILKTALDEYELIEQIGEGGAGRVWQAKDSKGSAVAIKILNTGGPTERGKRFKNEILFSWGLRHPNIIRVIDHGVRTTEAGQPPFYVMPLLQGSLRNLLGSVADFEQRLKYFGQLLSGVEVAHLQNTIHRDLKPENVLYDPTTDTVVVADFGIALFTDDEELYTAVETADDRKLANFKYAAPEQLSRGGATDARTDIFALGLILNELFTGKVPHGTGHKTVASVAPNYAWVDEVVDSMIQQDAAGRPQSIDEVKLHFLRQGQQYITRQRLSDIQRPTIELNSDPPAMVATGADQKTVVGPQDIELVIENIHQQGENHGLVLKVHNKRLANIKDCKVTVRDVLSFDGNGIRESFGFEPLKIFAANVGAGHFGPNRWLVRIAKDHLEVGDSIGGRIMSWPTGDGSLVEKWRLLLSVEAENLEVWTLSLDVEWMRHSESIGILS